ncbi:conserved protein of unknown function (plasmid) [Cupriavidus taiwanensis]|uniref:Uncharacterized protein n=1 Tax=Cupriavidus taiwanensis TaxID=164546 RepID=A0A375IT32_9BURK|nr:conserved protein of unknown function [Cupriavidus taiwanensis]
MPSVSGYASMVIKDARIVVEQNILVLVIHPSKFDGRQTLRERIKEGVHIDGHGAYYLLLITPDLSILSHRCRCPASHQSRIVALDAGVCILAELMQTPRPRAK